MTRSFLLRKFFKKKQGGLANANSLLIGYFSFFKKNHLILLFKGKLNTLILQNSYYFYFFTYNNFILLKKKHWNFLLSKNFFLSKSSFYFFNYFSSKNNFNCFLCICFFFNYINSIFSKCFFLTMGISDSLQIFGYARRSWYSLNKKFLYLKVGKSFINKFLIPSNLLILLTRRRLIKLFTYSVRLLIKYINSFYFLKPADPYKAFGIRILSKKLVIKQIYKRK